MYELQITKRPVTTSIWFLGCGNGSSFASNTSNTLTAMLSHPGSVDILDGTTIPEITER